MFRALLPVDEPGCKIQLSASDGLADGGVADVLRQALAVHPRGRGEGGEPTHLAIVLDKSGRLVSTRDLPGITRAIARMRRRIFKRQMPLMRDAVRAFGLIPVELERYEADDLIAGPYYPRSGSSRGGGGDRLRRQGSDAAGGPPCPLLRFSNRASRGKNGYRARGANLDVGRGDRALGRAAGEICGLLALTGDTSTTCPGVTPGSGRKPRYNCSKNYGDLDAAGARRHEIKQPKRRETLIENADKARLSRKLVLLDEKAPVPVPLADLTLAEIDAQKLIAFFKAMEFTTITKRVATEYDIDLNAVEADPELARRRRCGGRG